MYFPLNPPEVDAIFVKRINRFLGVALVNGREEFVHIHDPGRLQELLVPGARIWARRKSGGKTNLYLTAVELPDEIVLVDSSLHNKIAKWLVESGHFLNYTVEKTEPVYEDSRLDLLLKSPEGKYALVEVKGVTLEIDGVAYFPDAPTARGARHMDKLKRAVQNGYEAYVLFLVFRKKARVLSPNWKTDEKFARSFQEAVEHGVVPCAAKFEMFKWGLRYVNKIPVELYFKK
ncbi:MAG: DNA/RNA nuclease SfsA [Pyrobaculum sp.]